MKIRYWIPDNAAITMHSTLPDTFRGLKVLENAEGKYVEQPCEIELVEMSPVPEAVKVSILSEHRSYFPKGLRTPGLYKLRSAKLVLEERKDETRGSNQYEMLTCHNQAFTCEGSSYDDVRELVMRLRAGTILPHVSYANEQVKPVPQQFYDWVVAGIKIFKRDVLRMKGVY